MSPMLQVDFFFNLSSLKSRQDKALDVLHGFTRKIIDERFNDVIDQSDSKKKLAFLDVLMNAQTEDGKKLSKSDIQEEVSSVRTQEHMI